MSRGSSTSSRVIPGFLGGDLLLILGGFSRQGLPTWPLAAFLGCLSWQCKAGCASSRFGREALEVWGGISQVWGRIFDGLGQNLAGLGQNLRGLRGISVNIWGLGAPAEELREQLCSSGGAWQGWFMTR